ncbi:MAG: hypothetical protein M3503_08245 [Actinomycetota bacterium]|nr:hypothetical protein [Actinomycetota bacterium]
MSASTTQPEPNRPSSTQRTLKRYGPLAAVGLLVAGAIVVLGGGGDDDADTANTGGGDEQVAAPVAEQEGTLLTFQEAEEQGADIDFGESCDPETGRVAIPLRSAAPCVQPFEEGADNGGATSPGVTADAIKIVVYKSELDPLVAAAVGAAGADVDPDASNQTALDYLAMFEDVYETYGRRLDIEVVEATGGASDATAALADAQSVIDKQPFAVIGGPGQTDAYWQEIAAAGILCMGGCTLAEGWDNVEDAAPYIWPTALAPEQADSHLAGLLGKQLVGKPASFAGDEAMHDTERVFGWVQAETETGEYAARNDAFDAQLKEEYGGEIAVRSTYLFDIGKAQETATTVIARMRDAGVTTVILSVDPIVPKNITEEATKQGYFPEWVVGPSVLADTNIFGRTYDQQQWRNAVGLSIPATPTDNTLGDSYFVYDWYYGKPPPTNTSGVILPGPSQFMLGIHLAGPELTPESFRDGLFQRYPRKEPGRTYTSVGWGEDLWGRADYNAGDDAGAFWWDPDEPGEDETGNPGTGMKRFIDGGRRFLPDEWPEEEMGFFDEEGTVTSYEELPEGEEHPDYPPPARG